MELKDLLVPPALPALLVLPASPALLVVPANLVLPVTPAIPDLPARKALRAFLDLRDPRACLDRPALKVPAARAAVAAAAV